MGCNFRNVLRKKGVDIWRALLAPTDVIWMAEFDQRCVETMKKRNVMPAGVNVVTGDQSKFEDLNRWVKESGGRFHVFVDDGGHSNMQIYNTFQVMWEQIVPGGLYFIEDLYVSRKPYSEKPKVTYEDSKGEFIIGDIIKDWMEQLFESRGPVKHKIPPNVEFILCQTKACVIKKCHPDDLAHMFGGKLCTAT